MGFATRSMESLLAGPFRSAGSPSLWGSWISTCASCSPGWEWDPGDSRSRLALAASSIYAPPPRSGLRAWVPNMTENIRSQLHLPSQADVLQASGSNNMEWAVDGKPACHAPGPTSTPPPAFRGSAGPQRLWGAAHREGGNGASVPERGPGQGAGVHQLLGKQMSLTRWEHPAGKEEREGAFQRELWVCGDWMWGWGAV